MKMGGNDKLRAFWRSQKFPKSLTPKQRLDNKAMDKYRESLLAKTKGDCVAEIPFIGYSPRESASSNRLGVDGGHSSQSAMSSAASSRSHSQTPSKMVGFGSDGTSHQIAAADDGWADFGNWAQSIAAKTSAAATDLATKSKSAAVSIGSAASLKAQTVRSKLGDEEYQSNLKKVGAETWSKTTSTLSSWWSTAASSVQSALNEDGSEPVAFYNVDAAQSAECAPKRKMAALSSDQYFGASSTNISAAKQNEEDVLGMNGMDGMQSMNGTERENEKKKKKIDDVVAPFAANKRSKAQSDEFDEWGFDAEPADDDDGDDAAESQHETVDDLDPLNGGPMANKAAAKNDGNSSDELDAFFNEMKVGQTAANGTKQKVAEHKEDGHLLNGHGAKTEANDDDDDWGWD